MYMYIYVSTAKNRKELQSNSAWQHDLQQLSDGVTSDPLCWLRLMEPGADWHLAGVATGRSSKRSSRILAGCPKMTCEDMRVDINRYDITIGINLKPVIDALAALQRLLHQCRHKHPSTEILIEINFTGLVVCHLFLEVQIGMSSPYMMV